MDARKVEKITALLISAMIVCLSFSREWDWQTVGIYAGSNMPERLLYPFFHTNMFHALLNSWCLLSIIFIYDIGIINQAAVIQSQTMLHDTGSWWHKIIWRLSNHDQTVYCIFINI